MDEAFRAEMAAGYAFDEPVDRARLADPGRRGPPRRPRRSSPLSRVNRHGLIAGATGTGKTKTLQLLAGQLSAAGVPVFAVDVKGDLSGVGAPGDPTNPNVIDRCDVARAGRSRPPGHPLEILSLSGKTGAHVRASVSSFGPLLLGKVLDLNETQTSILSLVFRYCDDQDLPLLDLADLRTTLKFLGSDEGKPVLEDLGGISPASLGVILRAIVTIEQEGADVFFGEPEFDVDDLLRTTADGKGIVTLLEVADVMDRPRLYSTFVLWMLAQLYEGLPEVGDLPKPKLAFFFDEAHLLFKDASEALLDQIERTARLIRSKGVGVYFVTQAPTDVPSSVLSQLGNRVQHALRAFTPDDADALRKTARTFPMTDALRRRADDHEPGHRRGAGHGALAQGRPDAARRDPPRPAGLADGAAHRARDRRGRRRVAARRPVRRRRSTARAPTRSSRPGSPTPRPPPRPPPPRRTMRDQVSPTTGDGLGTMTPAQQQREIERQARELREGAARPRSASARRRSARRAAASAPAREDDRDRRSAPPGGSSARAPGSRCCAACSTRSSGAASGADSDRRIGSPRTGRQECLHDRDPHGHHAASHLPRRALGRVPTIRSSSRTPRAPASPPGPPTTRRRRSTRRPSRPPSRAFEVTRKLPAYERGRILREISAGIKARREELGATIAAEAGKPIRDALVEVDRAVLTFRLGAEEAERMTGEADPARPDGRRARTASASPAASRSARSRHQPVQLPAQPRRAQGGARRSPRATRSCSSRRPRTRWSCSRSPRSSTPPGVPEGMVSVLPMSRELGDRMVVRRALQAAHLHRLARRSAGG